MILFIILLASLILGGYLLRDSLADLIGVSVKELTTRGGLIYYIIYPIILLASGLINMYTYLHDLSNKLYTFISDLLRK